LRFKRFGWNNRQMKEDFLAIRPTPKLLEAQSTPFFKRLDQFLEYQAALSRFIAILRLGKEKIKIILVVLRIKSLCPTHLFSRQHVQESFL